MSALDPVEVGGWLTLVIFAVGMVLGIGLVGFRARKGPGSWNGIDVVALLGFWVWTSTGFSLLGARLSMGDFTHPEDVPLVAGMNAMGAAAVLTALLVFLRCERTKLGFLPPRWGWLLVAVLLELPVLGVSLAWTALLEAMGFEASQQAVLTMLQGLTQPLHLVIVATYAVVVAPLLEELLFRGVFFEPVRRRAGGVLAILVTGTLFGLIHISDPQAVPVLVVFGIMLGWLRLASGSIWPAIVLHVVNNAVALWATLAGLEI